MVSNGRGGAAMTKEQIYDEQINPLMAQILDICKCQNLSMVASFCLEPSETTHDDGSGPLLCTSLLASDDFDPPDVFLRVRDLLYSPRPDFVALMISTFPINTKGPHDV